MDPGPLDHREGEGGDVADGLTKHVERYKMDAYMKACGVVPKSGRHELCPYSGDV